MKETELQKSILDYLRLLENRGELYCFRVGSGGIKTQDGRYFKSGRAGVPDLICCRKGSFLGLEVKLPRGRQSPAQKIAEALIRKAGGEYIIVRSLDDVQKYLEK